MGEKIAAVLGVFNREKVTANFVTGWRRRLCLSIYKGLAGNAFCRECLVYHKWSSSISICLNS